MRGYFACALTSAAERVSCEANCLVHTQKHTQPHTHSHTHTHTHTHSTCIPDAPLFLRARLLTAVLSLVRPAVFFVCGVRTCACHCGTDCNSLEGVQIRAFKRPPTRLAYAWHTLVHLPAKLLGEWPRRCRTQGHVPLCAQPLLTPHIAGCCALTMCFYCSRWHECRVMHRVACHPLAVVGSRAGARD